MNKKQIYTLVTVIAAALSVDLLFPQVPVFHRATVGAIIGIAGGLIFFKVR